MVIPGWLLRHQVTVEPYLGQAATGPSYGAPVLVPCFIEEKRRKVRNQLGEEVVSAATVYCRPDVDAPPKSRVNVRGREAFVVTDGLNDGGGLPTPDHRELALT